MAIAENNRPPRILLVEDEAKTRASIREGLSLEGWTVTETGSGDEAQRLLFTGGFDLCVLDRMLPDLEGSSILRERRRAGDTAPVLMLTALGTVDDRVEGLDAGADD